MDNNMALCFKTEQATALKTLVDAEIERKLQAVHEYISAHYNPMGGYKADESWVDVKAKVVELVQSDLAQISKRLGGLVAVPVTEPEKS